ncbi:MAG TPA: hypothetical protein VGF01_09730, partial [Terracidiphilus sp.]
MRRMVGNKLFFDPYPGLSMRDWNHALVVSFPQRPSILHQSKEPFSQLMDAIDLAKVQSFFGEQFSSQA